MVVPVVLFEPRQLLPPVLPPAELKTREQWTTFSEVQARQCAKATICKGVQPCDCASASMMLHGSNLKASSFCFFGDETRWRNFLQKKSSEVFNKYALYFVRKVCVERFLTQVRVEHY